VPFFTGKDLKNIFENKLEVLDTDEVARLVSYAATFAREED